MTAVVEASAALEVWPIDKLIPAEDNVRGHRADDSDLDELARSITSVGVLQPLVATTTETTAESGELLLVAGHRRLAAAARAGLTSVPVVVHQGLDERTRVEMMVAENLRREQLTPLEEARAYERLAGFGLSQRGIAGRVGTAQGTVSKRLSLLLLPGDAQEALDSGEITVTQATALAKLHREPDRIRKALKPASWQSIDDAIAEQLRGSETAKKVAEARADLEKRGVTVLQAGPSWKDKTVYLGDKAAASHPAECLAAFVRDSDGTVEDYCTDPDAHPEPEEDEDDLGGEDDAETSELERWREERNRQFEAEQRKAGKLRKAREKEAAARKTVVRDLLDGAADTGVSGDKLALAFRVFALAGVSFVMEGEAWAPDVCELLGVQTPETSRPIERWSNAWPLALADAADIKGAAAWYALGLAMGECCLAEALSGTREFDLEDDADKATLQAARLYLHELAGDGNHQPTPAELSVMGEGPDPAAPVVTVSKRGKTWRVDCSECGQVSARQTTEQYADEAAEVHRQKHAAGEIAIDEGESA